LCGPPARSPNESPGDAQKKTQEFIQNKQSEAKTAGTIGDSPSPKALTKFGQASHPVTDATSPAHEGTQAWKLNVGDTIDHVAKEQKSDATPERMGNAVEAIQRLYGETFGEEALQRATDANNPTAVEDRKNEEHERLERNVVPK
jgi:hypothetical protein